MKDCKIIQDLLPNYIDNLASDETKEYVEKHLKECEECNNVLESMKSNIQLNETKPVDKEVKYLKKFNRKIKTLGTIVLIMFVVFVAVMTRRIIIVANLSSKANQINRDNYYAKVEGILNGKYSVSKCYYKDGEYVLETTSYIQEEGLRKVIFYKKGNEKILLTESDDGKFLTRNALLTEITPLPYYNDSIEILCMALVHGVESTELDGVECYVLKNKNYEQYINKETGLMLKRIDRVNNTVTDYYYEFDIVDDINLPDLTEYANGT